MKPLINDTRFGNIQIDNQYFDHDVVINLEGEVKKRKKKLSKEKYGTSHKVSVEEAKHIYEKGADKIVIGSGQYGVLELSKEAIQYFKKKNCKIKLLPTPEAVKEWNESTGPVISMFHITC